MINHMIAKFCGLPVDTSPRPILSVTRNRDGSYNWTPESDQKLLQFLADGWSVNDIALCSLISYGSIQSRIYRIRGKRKKNGSASQEELQNGG